MIDKLSYNYHSIFKQIVKMNEPPNANTQEETKVENQGVDGFGTSPDVLSKEPQKASAENSSVKLAPEATAMEGTHVVASSDQKEGSVAVVNDLEDKKLDDAALSSPSEPVMG